MLGRPQCRLCLKRWFKLRYNLLNSITMALANTISFVSLHRPSVSAFRNDLRGRHLFDNASPMGVDDLHATYLVSRASTSL